MRRAATRRMLLWTWIPAALASGCGGTHPDPTVAAAADSSLLPSCTPVSWAEMGRAAPLGDRGIAAEWASIASLLGAEAPDLARLPDGWPFPAVFVLARDPDAAESAEPIAVLAARAGDLSGRSAELRDLVAALAGVRPPPKRFDLIRYEVDDVRNELRLGERCTLDLPASDVAALADSAAMALLSRHLALMGELVGARVEGTGDDRVLYLIGTARTAGSPPPLTVDDLARSWRAAAHRCDCDTYSGHHVCKGAFVSLDPDEVDKFAPAHVELAPCVVDSHMGQVLTNADVLIKELAKGRDLHSGEPIDLPPGHNTERKFLADDTERGQHDIRYWFTSTGVPEEDRVQVPSQDSPDHGVIYVGKFHPVLMTEETDSSGEVVRSDEPETASLLGAGAPYANPQGRFAEQINEHFEDRYKPAYPILGELTNVARLVEVMAWIHRDHPDTAFATFAERLRPGYQPTPRTLAMSAASSVSVTDATQARRTASFVSFGGVIVGSGDRAAVVAVEGRIGNTIARTATRSPLKASSGAGEVKHVLRPAPKADGLTPLGFPRVHPGEVPASASREIKSVLGQPVNTVRRVPNAANGEITSVVTAREELAPSLLAIAPQKPGGIRLWDGLDEATASPDSYIRGLLDGGAVVIPFPRASDMGGHIASRWGPPSDAGVGKVPTPLALAGTPDGGVMLGHLDLPGARPESLVASLVSGDAVASRFLAAWNEADLLVVSATPDGLGGAMAIAAAAEGLRSAGQPGKVLVSTGFPGPDAAIEAWSRLGASLTRLYPERYWGDASAAPEGFRLVSGASDIAFGKGIVFVGGTSIDECRKRLLRWALSGRLAGKGLLLPAVDAVTVQFLADALTDFSIDFFVVVGEDDAVARAYAARLAVSEPPAWQALVTPEDPAPLRVVFGPGLGGTAR